MRITAGVLDSDDEPQRVGVRGEVADLSGRHERAGDNYQDGPGRAITC